MGRWRLTCGQFFFAAIVSSFAVSAALETARAGAYLSKTGPVPLRFSTAPSQPLSALLPPLARNDRLAIPTNDAPSLTNAAAQLVMPVAATVTNETSSISNALEPGSLLPFESLSTTSAPPAQVTPQMLVEYLTPLPGSTNGSQGMVVVPAAIDFTPPMPRPRSQAIYQSK